MLINIYPTYLSGDTRNVYFYFPPKFLHNMENQPNKLNIEGFDPETNGRSRPSVGENGICWDLTCQKLGYCRLKNEEDGKCK